MTITVQHNRVIHTGNSATTIWPADFSAMDDGDVEVYLYEIATGTLTMLSGAEYNIIGVPGNTFSIQYPLADDPLANTHKIIIQRIVDLLQPATFSNTVGFDPATLTLQLDDMVRQIQQINDGMQRSLKVDISGTDDPDVIINDFLDAVADAQAAAAAAEASAVESAASAAAAEAAKEAAEEAAASIDLPVIVANTMLVANSAGTERENKTFPEVRDLLNTGPYLATRTEIKNLNPTTDQYCTLTESGRVGEFVWAPGDFSALVAQDTQEGLYIASNIVPATTGAWVRAGITALRPTWFGAVADGVTDATVGLQACVTLAAGRWIDIVGTYRVPAGDISVPSTGLRLMGSGEIMYEGVGYLFRAGQIVLANYSHTATAGQTVFVSADPYTGCYIEVFVNGVRRDHRLFTVAHDTTNLTVTFTGGGAALNDAVQLRVHRFHTTTAVLGVHAQVILGAGVRITTTQANEGMAFALAWQDAGFAAGRQTSAFVMEPGAIIMGKTGDDGFKVGIWLHAHQNVQIAGHIFGIGANKTNPSESQDTSADTAILLSGELTPSSVMLCPGGSIGFYYKGVAQYWGTAEGVSGSHFVWLNVGYAVYWLARTNNVGLLLGMNLCHANCFRGVAYTDYVSSTFISDNDFFQGPHSTASQFRFIEIANGAKDHEIHSNQMQSYIVGANWVGIQAGNGVRNLRSHDNHFIAADSTSVGVAHNFLSGSFSCVVGPNSYENVDRTVSSLAGSDKIGLLTAGDQFITPPGVNTRYSMLGTNWWFDEKWLVITNGAAQSIANATIATWVFTESRDPESLYTAAPITAPTWATRCKIKGTLKWAASATGVRFARIVRGGVTIELNHGATISPADNTATHDFNLEFGVVGGNTIEFQVYQSSGAALNLNPSIVQVLFL